ncbi:MAG: CorA family divalent cation transporter [Lachnospiraceae bacterium]
MYYIIENDRIHSCEESTFYENDDAICILTEEEWKKDEKLREVFQMRFENPSLHFCKIENHPGYLYATIHIPSKEEGKNDQMFAFYLLPEKIIFIDNEILVTQHVKMIANRKLRTGYSLERFLYDFLMSFLDEDLLFLQSVEKRISQIEELILRRSCPDFNVKMLKLKKKIARFYHYYSQLTDVGQELLVNEMEFFEKDDLQLFDNYKDRASRLASETQLLRDYAMQVQEVYQSEIGIRQNDIMKMLTIVTTIFLPLTLIAGWYGMNFAFMPELSSPYGYPVVIGVSIFIVVFSLIFFKKKKYW